jgi:hypothetical protein
LGKTDSLFKSLRISLKKWGERTNNRHLCTQIIKNSNWNGKIWGQRCKNNWDVHWKFPLIKYFLKTMRKKVIFAHLAMWDLKFVRSDKLGTIFGVLFWRAVSLVFGLADQTNFTLSNGQKL